MFAQPQTFATMKTIEPGYYANKGNDPIHFYKVLGDNKVILQVYYSRFNTITVPRCQIQVLNYDYFDFDKTPIVSINKATFEEKYQIALNV